MFSMTQNLAAGANPTFSTLSLLESSSQLKFGNILEGYSIISAQSPGAGKTYTYTIPTAIGSNAYFVMSEGDDVINGLKTFTNIKIDNVSSHLVPSSDKTYDIGSVSKRWRNLYLANGGGSLEMVVGSNGQSSLSLYGDPSTTSHMNFGMVKDTPGVNIGSKYHFSCRTSGENDEFRFYRGQRLGGYTQIMTFTGSGPNQDRVTFDRSNDATSRTDAPVIFKGGVGIAKELYANEIEANNITIGGSAINLNNLVTTNTVQSITGQKTFTADRVLIGSVSHGELRLSTYAGGDSRIHGGYVTDSEYYLEFYCRGVMVARMSNGYPGSGRDRWFDLYGGLRFPNGGGSFLNYYERWNQNVTFVANWDTSINTNPTATINATRIGNDILIHVYSPKTNFTVTGSIHVYSPKTNFTVTGSTNCVLNSNIALPSQFRPVQVMECTVAVRQNSVFRFTTAEVQTDGIIKVGSVWNVFPANNYGSNYFCSFSTNYRR